MSKTTGLRRPLTLVGFLMAMVSFQACVPYSFAFLKEDFAVIGVDQGQEQEVFRNTFAFGGDGLCNLNPGSVLFSGHIGQVTSSSGVTGVGAEAASLPTSLSLNFRHLDESGNPIRTQSVNLAVNGDGDIPDQFFYQILPPGCFARGHQLVVSAQPNEGNISEGASLKFSASMVFPNSTLTKEEVIAEARRLVKS